MARILIADDDPHAAEVIARICQYKGHDTREARDAVHAIATFGAYDPDLVITDLAMPLGGGQHFLREMRATHRGRSCPVIVVTGYAALLGAAEQDSLGPCRILQKPLELEPLLAAIEEGLDALDVGAGAPEEDDTSARPPPTGTAGTAPWAPAPVASAEPRRDPRLN